MPELTWFLIDRNGERVGPLTTKELVSKLLSPPPETLVWHHGMQGWRHAKEVDALAPLLPPPAPADQESHGPTPEAGPPHDARDSTPEPDPGGVAHARLPDGTPATSLPSSTSPSGDTDPA